VLKHSPLAVLLVLCSAAPALAQSRSTAADVVFVADGAGNYQYASKLLRTAIHDSGAPLDVITFVWSHGYKRCLLDQMDLPHAREQGRLLAEVVLAYRHDHPDARIHLLGHSAGSMVILTATEYLPPGTVDCVVLLGPSVSCNYDVRPALRCARGSVEVHYSSHDWMYLGLCTSLVGCADRRYCGASGRKGFVLTIESEADEALLPHLRQHPWQATDRELGNNGGHYGAYQPAYLQARVLPVLLGGG
jgi:pimeloyl-ACP methyl ester carboxylesterase